MRRTEPQAVRKVRRVDMHASLVIDGEAILVKRRATQRKAEPDRAAPDAFPAHAQALRTAAQHARVRRAGTKRQDLFFQGPSGSFGMAAPQAAANASLAGRGAMVVATAPRARSMRLAAGIVLGCALFALLPVLALQGLKAPLDIANAVGGEPLILAELSHRIEPHGSGAVLTVAGLIRNRSAESATVPPLRIALAEPGGGFRAKSFQASVSRLPSGASLRFHSAVAIAKGTQGAVEVGFLDDAAAGPRSE